MSTSSSARRPRAYLSSSPSLAAGLALALALSPALMQPAAGNVLPGWSEIELQARASFASGFNLPAGSSFNSGTPAINDAGEMSFRLLVVGGTGGFSGLWKGANGSGSVVHVPAQDWLIGDPSIDSSGRVLFEQFDVFTDGLYIYDAEAAQPVTQVVAPGGAFSINTITAARLNDAGRIGFRAGVPGGNRWIFSDGGVQTSVAQQTSGIAFLFSPSLAPSGRMAGKVRLGSTAGSAPDQIRLYESDGSFTTIVHDADSQPGSPFAGFDNSISIADGDVIAFIADLTGGGRGVFRVDGGGVTEIATTLYPEISVVEFFPPAVNADGLVVFRGRDAQGQDVIMVGDGSRLVRVVGRNDIVETDLGPARIARPDTALVFGGAPAINAHGDVAFNAQLTDPDNNQVQLGSGMFIAYADDDGIPGDLDGDGEVNFADLLILLSAWGPCAPGGCAEDLNGDEVVDFADLLVLLTSWT